eukprot:gene16170-22329_t
MMRNVTDFFKKWSSNGPKHGGGDACMHPASQEETAYNPQAVRASRRGGHLASGTGEWRRFLPLTDNTYRLVVCRMPVQFSRDTRRTKAGAQSYVLSISL